MNNKTKGLFPRPEGDAMSHPGSSPDVASGDGSGLNRRNLLKISALAGGGLAGQAALPTRASAQQPAQTPPPGARGSRGSRGGMNLGAILAKAREQLYPTCMVCPVCDGVACASAVGTHFGAASGSGTGMSFRNNFTALDRVKLVMHNVHEEMKADPSTTIFGQKLSFPAVCAPMGPGGEVWGKGVSDEVYYDALVGGPANAGTLGACGDSLSYPEDACRRHIAVVAQYKGRALYNCKPHPTFELTSKFIPAIKAAGPAFVSMDVDSGSKTVAQLRELVKAFDPIPFVVKGIMTPDDGLRAVEAGAKGIVVSNHGGRNLDYTPGTAQVLPGIAAKLKGKTVILVDGCVQTGIDVLKYLALGADAVQVGRANIRALYGGGTAAVTFYMNLMRTQFQDAMQRTGVSTVSKINSSIITV
jgi:4-hydroxymandelate oxidase